MITIKSYTDFSQSKKLAKILPIESADMVWSSVFYEGIPKNGDEKLINAYLDPETNHFYFAELYEEFVYNSNNTKEYPSIPCWSLAALFKILGFLEFTTDKISEDKSACMVSTYIDGRRYDSMFHDYAVDACYALILKLHELELL